MKPNGVDVVSSNDVQFTFRSEELDVDVTIEGKKAWVKGIVDDLGLSEVGSMIPLGVTSPIGDPKSVEDNQTDEDILVAPTDMGPEPDPSRIPVVKRPIGALDTNLKSKNGA